MKNILPKRFGIIQKVIIALAVIMMTVVWPLGAFRVNHVSTCEWDGVRMSGPSNENGFVRQTFSPNYEKLQSISVYVVNDPEYIDTMKAVLRVYNSYGHVLSETYFQVEDYELPGYITIPVELKVTPETLYYYTIAGVDGDLLVAYNGDDGKTAENGMFFYKEIHSGGTSIVTQYEYERPMGYKRIIICDSLIAVVAFAMISLIGIAKNAVFKKCSEEKAILLWKRAERIVCYSVMGVVAAGVITAFWGIVINKLFTDDVLDIIVLFCGVVIAALYICYGVFTCTSETEALEEGEETIAVKVVNILRSLLFATALIMCCLYQDGTTNYEKGLYLRKFLVFLGLFMISLGKRRYIWNIPNVIWSIAALLFGRYYISVHSDNIEHIITATNDAWVIWVIGLVVIQLVYKVVKGDLKKLKGISFPHGVLTVFFLVACMVFANGRSWPMLTGVVLLLWGVFYVSTGEREKIVENICNGIILAFLGSVIFCLYRRPFQYYMLARYGGIIFTATATATYYLVPTAAALVKIIFAAKENNKRKLIYSSAFFGIVAAYMSFTASRTGIFAMIAMVLFAFIVIGYTTVKEALKKSVRVLAIMLISSALCFVMSFSATRMIPAMSANPFYFEYEKPSAFMNSETPWRGATNTADIYMDVRSVLNNLFGRLLKAEITFDEEEENVTQQVETPENVADNGSRDLTATTYSSGRLDIFKAYLTQLNMSGHDTMAATDSNGKSFMHAHNAYIQVAYDFGVPVGILFLVFCLFTFLISLKRAFAAGVKTEFSYLPMFIIIGFGVASLFEWVYHICNPLGMSFLIMLAPIMIRKKAANK